MGHINTRGYINTMASAAMHRLRYANRYTIFGLGMLVAATLLVLVTTLSFQANAQLRTALSQPIQTPTQTSMPAVHPRTPVDMTERFYALLPDEHQADTISAQILRSADSLGMVFEHAEFKSIPVEDAHLEGGRLIVQHIKLPLTGNYIQVRQFLNALLNAYPSLALTALNLQRDNALSGQVEAQIEFTLYLRKELDKRSHKEQF